VGGESLFLDLFHVAEEFRHDHPKFFDTLTHIPASFKKIHFKREWPVFMFYQKPHIQVNHRSKVLIKSLRN
jgi:gamma-butyrobetaine dioxygenase